MFNFRDIADLFISNNAAVMLRDGLGLSGAISKFLNDPDEARQTGQRGRQLISLNIGATLRNVEVITLVMPGR